MNRTAALRASASGSAQRAGGSRARLTEAARSCWSSSRGTRRIETRSGAAAASGRRRQGVTAKAQEIGPCGVIDPLYSSSASTVCCGGKREK
ncbi:hypothetical protein C1I64_12650 [Rathayibacter festucae DSM 15932]|uniref:Uncharacterized protein n=1 Tax=Rathayibacter festucae DSM 15932 TaxID=1328866 RepID=A0A3T0T2G9_9MICO|nr:hypothetical protein C1I64_12650 [Rathayibacter festucae DSM 15932]